MEIHSSKTWNLITAITFSLVAGISVWMYMVSGLLFALFILPATCSPILVMFWIATGRKLRLDKHGILVSFLWFKKKYAWEEMQTKMHFYGPGMGYRIVYTSGMVFSKKRVPNFPNIKPFQYNVFWHPFSCIVIHFRPDVACAVEYPALFEADYNTLVELLNKWGVVVDGNKHH